MLIHEKCSTCGHVKTHVTIRDDEERKQDFIDMFNELGPEYQQAVISYLEKHLEGMRC